MTKAKTKIRHHHKPAGPARKKKTPPPAGKTDRTKVIALLAVILLAGIPFAIGKYIEFNTPGPYDSGGYVYSAKHILSGAVLGVDEHPSAQIGTLLVNMLGVWLFGFRETGPEIIQMICQAAALVMMFIAMHRLFGMLPAAVGVIVASVYLSAPLIAKFGNVKEQYMIAFMVLGVSFFVLRQRGGRWYYAAIAGAFLSWAPLFKPTGLSACTAVALFVILQPFFKNRNWKQTLIDIALMIGGAVVVIAPIYIWVLASGGRGNLPYAFILRPLGLISQADSKPVEPIEPKTDSEQSPQKQGFLQKFLPAYVTGSWRVLKPEQRAEVVRRVFRYYKLLILPIALAVVSILARLLRLLLRSAIKLKPKDYDKFVLLFALWWLLDMAFIWVSPRSYEQYYLPLNASAAMLGGYIVALYRDQFNATVFKGRWILVGIVGLVLMIAMSWHIFFGIQVSPHSGTVYKDRAGRPEKRRGYLQRFREARRSRLENWKAPWQRVAEYIRLHSDPTDRIYVWGWYPGIYVEAKRLGATTKAGESTMHTLTPKQLSRVVERILNDFKKNPPKFIVDTHKIHYPWDRPPLELWPRTKRGFISPDKASIERYDNVYIRYLKEEIGEDEAQRYEAMRPLREYVMQNYRIVPRNFGQHVLFERKTSNDKAD